MRWIQYDTDHIYPSVKNTINSASAMRAMRKEQKIFLYKQGVDNLFTFLDQKTTSFTFILKKLKRKGLKWPIEWSL